MNHKNRLFVFASVLFCLLSGFLVAKNDEDIVKRHGLLVGKYLHPANQKVILEDWHHPTIRDYWKIQHYLTQAPRPELQYLNFQGSPFRADRMRNFRLITNEVQPKFEIISLNEDPSERKNCIVTYVSINDNYIRKQQELIQRLRSVGFNGHVIQRIGG